MSKLRALLAFLLLAITLQASVTVAAHFTDPAGNPVKFSFLRFELVRCGNNLPQSSLPGTIVQRVQEFRPSASTGILTGSIFANNEIACGGSYSTLWHVTAFSNGNTPVAGDKDYLICSVAANCATGNAGPTWDLATAQPFTGTLPPPGFQDVFANPTANQSITQPAGTVFSWIGGSVDFTNTTVTGITGGGGGGTTVKINGVTVDTPNFGNTPSAPSGSLNVTWTFTGANVSGSIPLGTTALTAAAGNDSRITGAEQSVNKDALNGYAGLDAAGKLKTAEFPSTITSGTTGNAATATALASTPSQCAGGQLATGITASGTANCNPRIADDTSTLSYSASGGLSAVKYTSTAGGSSIQTLTVPCSASAGVSDPCITVKSSAAVTVFTSNNDGTAQIGTGTSGIFTLTAIQTTGTVATVGLVRVPNNTNGTCWRNAANSADLCLKVDGSNALLFNGSAVGGGGGGGGGFDTITTGVNTTGTMTVSTGASILISGTGIVTANKSVAAGIAFPGATSGTATVLASAIAGTPVLTLPNTTGTFAVGASAPLVLSATTGGLTCPNCVTGGSLTANQLIGGNGVSAIKVVNLTGDATTTNTLTVTNIAVNGVSYPAAPSIDSVPVVTASNTATYKLVPNCTASNCALQYNTTTHAYGTTNITGTLSGLTTNRLLKALSSSSAGDSLLADDGATLTYTGTGGVTATKFVNSSSTTAGFVALTQGPANGAGANSITLQAPSVVTTGYVLTLPTGAPGAVGPYLTDASGNVTFGTRQGNTAAYVTATGAFTTNNLTKTDANGNLVDAGFALASVSGNTTKAATVSGALTSGNLTKSDASGNLVDGGIAIASLSGNTTKVVTLSGAVVNGHCAQWDASGNAIDSGGSCGGGGGSGTVNSGTANQLAYYAGTGTAVSGTANLTISGSDFTMGVAGSAVGTLSFGNATSGTIKLTPPTGALGSAVLTLPIGTQTLVGKSTTDVFTNKTQDAEGTGNVITRPFYAPFDAASCSNAVAGIGSLDFDGAYTVNCLTGTNNVQGTWDMPDSGTTKGQLKIPLPTGWTGNLDINLNWLVTASGGSNAVKFTVETACTAIGATYDTAWNAAQTITTNVGANNIVTQSQQLAVTTTGCSALNILRVRIGRDTTDTFTGTARLLGGYFVGRSTK